MIIHNIWAGLISKIIIFIDTVVLIIMSSGLALSNIIFVHDTYKNHIYFSVKRAQFRNSTHQQDCVWDFVSLLPPPRHPAHPLHVASTERLSRLWLVDLTPSSRTGRYRRSLLPAYLAGSTPAYIHAWTNQTLC